MARNGIAGSSKGKSATARYYQKNKKARAVKDKYNTSYHSSSSRRKYRGKLNSERRRRKIYGKGGKDVSHTKTGKMILEKSSSNRSRNRGKK